VIPMVTVLMPVHNGARFLRLAMDSVLQQTVRELELLIIDDGSTDGSAEIIARCRDPRVRVHRHERNLGVIPSLNTGLELARAPYIARMDCDDLAAPRRLELQLDHLERHPEVAAVGSCVELIDARGRSRGRAHGIIASPILRWISLFDNCFCHPAVTLRREALRRTGLRYGEVPRSGQRFAAALELDPGHVEDYLLLGALCQLEPVFNLPQVLLQLRLHDGSVSSRQLELQRERSPRVSALFASMLLGRAVDAAVFARTKLRPGAPRARLDRAATREGLRLLSLMEAAALEATALSAAARRALRADASLRRCLLRSSPLGRTRSFAEVLRLVAQRRPRDHRELMLMARAMLGGRAPAVLASARRALLR